MDRITDTSPDIRIALRTVGYDVIHDSVMSDSRPVAAISGNLITITAGYQEDKRRIQEVVNKLNAAGGNFTVV